MTLEEMMQQQSEDSAQYKILMIHVRSAVRMLLNPHHKEHRVFSRAFVAGELLRALGSDWCWHCGNITPTEEMCQSVKDESSMCRTCRDDLALEVDREQYVD